jgi:hypothetical protein
MEASPFSSTVTVTPSLVALQLSALAVVATMARTIRKAASMFLKRRKTTFSGLRCKHKEHFARRGVEGEGGKKRERVRRQSSPAKQENRAFTRQKMARCKYTHKNITTHILVAEASRKERQYVFQRKRKKR